MNSRFEVTWRPLQTITHSVSYISYAISYHEQTDDIINLIHFEEGGLVENERNVE